MTEQRWIVKERNFELDAVKYQVKLNPVFKDQDPLRVDLGNLDIIKKKKAQKKNIIYQKVEQIKSENDKIKFNHKNLEDKLKKEIDEIRSKNKKTENKRKKSRNNK